MIRNYKELAKLIEGLAITASPFSLGTGQFVSAFSDAGEIVNRDGLICSFSLLDESITDGEVHCCNYTLLAAFRGVVGKAHRRCTPQPPLLSLRGLSKRGDSRRFC
jgi:hypothetical protein